MSDDGNRTRVFSLGRSCFGRFQGLRCARSCARKRFRVSAEQSLKERRNGVHDHLMSVTRHLSARRQPATCPAKSLFRTSIRPVTTKAWLQGHQFDLQDLAELLVTGDVRVVHDVEEGSYYLAAPQIDNPPEGTTLYDVAQRLLAHINGIGRVNKADDFRPVQLTGQIRHCDRAKHGHCRRVSEIASTRTRRCCRHRTLRATQARSAVTVAESFRAR
jgi:hypothetical protein